MKTNAGKLVALAGALAVVVLAADTGGAQPQPTPPEKIRSPAVVLQENRIYEALRVLDLTGNAWFVSSPRRNDHPSSLP